MVESVLDVPLDDLRFLRTRCTAERSDGSCMGKGIADGNPREQPVHEGGAGETRTYLIHTSTGSIWVAVTRLARVSVCRAGPVS